MGQGQSVSVRNLTNGKLTSDVVVETDNYYIRLPSGEALQTIGDVLVHVYRNGMTSPVVLQNFTLPLIIEVVRGGIVLSKDRYTCNEGGKCDVRFDLTNDYVLGKLDCSGNVCRNPFDAPRYAMHTAPRQLGLMQPDPYPYGQNTYMINYTPDKRYLDDYLQDPVYTTGAPIAKVGGAPPVRLGILEYMS